MTIAGNGPIWLAGAGNMGGAMLRGWLGAGVEAERILIIRPSGAAVDGGVQVLKSPPPDGEMPAVLVLAMKPQKLDEAVPALAPLVGEGTLIVSVLAGVEVASLAKRFPKHRGIVRVMPNTPVAIGKGVALLHADAERREHEARLDLLRVEVGDARLAVAVRRADRVELTERGADVLRRVLGPEVAVEAARLRDRVERRVRDEPVHLAADEQPLLAVDLRPLHAALLHLARHEADERVLRLVVVLVRVEHAIAEIRHGGPP